MPPLPQSFFARPVDALAPALLGCQIKRGRIVLVITEVEAYAGPEDSASHARFGRTDRNAPMWGPPGRAYVYLCYGIHNMLNVSADAPGRAAAVLIRGCEAIAGLDELRRRRGLEHGAPIHLDGPGKIGAALDLDPTWSGHRLYRSGGLNLRSPLAPRGDRPAGLLAGPRVGIDFARPEDRQRPWRFALPRVSARQRRGLAPA